MHWKILAGVSAVAAAVALTAIAVPQVGADPAGVTFSALGQPDTASSSLASRCTNANARFNQHDFGAGFRTDGPTGTRDLFLSNTVRTHRKLRRAGVIADLNVYEGQSHAQYQMNIDAPETKEAFTDIAKFFDRYLKQ